MGIDAQAEVYFNVHLARVRELHRLAQTEAGIEQVIRQVGSLTIDMMMRRNYATRSFNDALLIAIAEAVIPGCYQWRVDESVGTAANIIFEGVF